MFDIPIEFVIPGRLEISNITQTDPMVITIVDSDENTYIVGQLVHLSIPPRYGMTQANQLTGQIIEINGLDFTVNIDASQFDSFILDGSLATLAPAGSRNLEYSNFTNLVPFQNLNN